MKVGFILKTRIHNDIFNVYNDYENNEGRGPPSSQHPKGEALGYRMKMTDAVEAADDPDEKQDIRDGKTKEGRWLKNILYIKMKLLQGTYVNGLMKSVRDLFYKKEIMEKFDTDTSLIGFDNGIYDLKSNVFREGRPEDYITKSTGFSIPIGDAELPIRLSDINSHLSNYIKEYDTFKRDLDTFIQQIIPLEEVRQYTLRFLSKCLSGENRDEGFYIWTGSGGNGKSKLIEIAQLVLGEYGCGLPVSLITSKRASSNSATPEMERTKGIRLAVMQEPEADECINIGLMKELTGNDKIIARGLYKEPVEFVPQFKLLLMCNELPNIPSNDDGTWRRLEVVDFISRFIGEEDQHKINNKRHIYKRDKELRNKLPAWKLVFLGILLEEWMKYDKEGIKVPKQVNNKTKSYRNENDIVGQWIEQVCEIVDNIKNDNGQECAPTVFEDLFFDFKGWCQEQGHKSPDKKKTKDDLLKWQEQSTYGLSLGRNMKQGRPNGSERTPYFNLKVVDGE